MNGDPLGDWPVYGRVGKCTVGSAAGSYILLYEERRPGWWTYLLSEPRVDTGEIDGYIDDVQEMAELLSRWGVIWLSPEDDDRIEREVFGVRKQMKKAEERQVLRSRFQKLFRRGA